MTLRDRSEQASSDVTIELCGRLGVTVDGRSREPELGRQGRLVVAYLALHRERSVTRERLITALWGDDSPPEYAQRLNVVLSKLRRAVGPGVVQGTDAHGVQLAPGARVDLEEVEAGLGEAVAAAERRDWRATARAAEHVVEIARGGVLPGHEADWLEAPRRRLQEIGLKGGELLAEAGLALGGAHLLSAERAAQAVVEADPLREPGSLLLMRVRAAQGHTVDAERVYHDLRRLTLEELGRGPGPAVKAEFERLLRSAHEDVTATAVRAAPQGSFFATRSGGAFVGRRSELERLSEHFRRAATGQRRLLLLEGEPGIGKTRLALQLMSVCEAEGALALYGRCDAETLITYQPFVEALRRYLARGAPERSRAWAERYGEDIRFIPELAKALGIRAPARDAAEDSERYRLFEAVSEMLAEIAQDQPVVLVVDDLHWAPKPTLLMLREVVRSTAAAPLLIVGTYRRTEPAADLVDMLVHLRREHQFERVTLDGLDKDDAGELIEQLSARPLPEELSRAISEETEGSPFFLEEMLRHVESRVPAADSDAREWWRHHDLPESIREVIGQRLAAMSERTSQALRVAAVIGREFSFELLEAIGPLQEDELYDVVEESLGAHVVADVPGEYGRYSFTHSLIRQTLYEGITATRRARMHAAVGQALERLHGGAAEPPLAELAHHFSLAPPAHGATRAVEYAERAAGRALDELAYEEAARLYGMALDALGQDAPVLPRRCGLLLRLGEAQAKAGEVAAARATFGRAAEAARRLDAPRELARAALGYGTVGQMSGGVVDAGVVALLEEALSALGEGDAALRARLLARLAMELSFSEQRERRAALSEQALGLARAVGDTRGLGYALVARHWSLWGPANVEDRLVAANDLLRLAKDSHDERLAMQGHRWRMIDLLELGEIDGVDVEIEAFERLAAKRRRPSEAPYGPLFRAMRLLLAGEFDQAEAVSAHARQLGERVQDTNAIQAHVLQMVALWRERGGVEGIEDLVRRQAERFPSIPGWGCVLAHVHAESGHDREALPLLDTFARDEFRGLPHDGLWLGAIALLAEAAAALGEPRHAEGLYALLEPYADRNVAFGWVSACGGSASRHLGLLAGLLGRRDDAIAHFEKALQINVRMGARPLVARTRLDLARALVVRSELAAGDVRPAGEQLERALDEARALGMTRLLEDGRRLSRSAERLQRAGRA
jgi:DNA-binding SARP family transcriptional activator/tetratricopeptide (TPR) repeat protein